MKARKKIFLLNVLILLGILIYANSWGNYGVLLAAFCIAVQVGVLFILSLLLVVVGFFWEAKEDLFQQAALSCFLCCGVVLLIGFPACFVAGSFY